MQQGDVPRTFADVDELIKDYNILQVQILSLELKTS